MPNTHTVTVYPPSGTASGYCDPDTVNPVGQNAHIQFKFPQGTSGWSFISTNAFQIKSSANPQPPADMFTQQNSSSSQVVIQDKNGDGNKYPYNITITNGTTNTTIDPYIQNET